jgi:hypothetical protein
VRSSPPLPARIGPVESVRWLVTRHRIGAVIRTLERETDPLFGPSYGCRSIERNNVSSRTGPLLDRGRATMHGVKRVYRL